MTGPYVVERGLHQRMLLEQRTREPDQLVEDDPVVEAAGIEPASCDASPGLLRAQFALPLLGPPDLTNESG
ncbi:hypothetical protein IN07_02850 [Modestobacter caceresii]|uniref:Uncharacterized protein n=1 Tax=Modestobacter caceresii TaxID=1522368 RepID=A0A098YBZ9_9ACTN|nr:hypothetical protein IN07_02850 [Modestobacter caceresii]